MFKAAILSLLILLGADSKPFPLIHGHSHNDYQQKQPLTLALECEFCSIEADVHLINGQLLVAHDIFHVRPGKTLESMYLDPLRKRIEENSGRVYPEAPTIVLLIDMKTEPVSTYRAIRERLQKYSSLFTRWEDGKKVPGAMTAMITGTAFSSISLEMQGEKIRYAAMDGHVEDLLSNRPPSPDFVPQVAGPWRRYFHWSGKGEMSAADRQKLQDLAKKAHDQHRTLRIWDNPDNANVWAEERKAGVDWINTDSLKEFREWSTKNDPDRELPETIR